MRRIHRASVSTIFPASLLSTGAGAEGRLSVERAATLNAAPETVWKKTGGYNDLDVWHPAVARREMTGSGTTEDDTRMLTLGDGATITEKLLAYCDHGYSYAIEAPPLPAENCVSTIEVSPKDGGGSIVKCKSSFDPKGPADEKATEVTAGSYEAGLGRLTGCFNGK